MVGAIKRWLGIERLERENLKLARSLQSAHARIGQLEIKFGRKALEIAELTSEPPAPKIVAKPPVPKRVNWRQAREALEKASEPQEQEA